MSRRLFCAFSVLVLAAGCSGGGSGTKVDDGRFDELTVGGTLVYCKDSDVHLPGTISMTGFEGEALTATANSDGIWEIEDVPEGVYSFAGSLAGYETRTDVAVVSQPEGSPSAFFDFGAFCLEESLATATIAPFGVTVRNGEELVSTVEYSKATGGDIVITFDRPVVAAAFNGPGAAFGGIPVLLYLYDGLSFQFVTAVDPGAPHLTYTFPEASLDAFNGGAGLTTSGALHLLDLYAIPQFDPINGASNDFYGTLRFRAVP